jgi:hydroxyacylglutathione hydrolase
MTVEQIKVGADNFSYLIYDRRGGSGALVDPSTDPTKALSRIRELGIELKYLINTHHHTDHTAENGTVLVETKAKLVASKEESKKIREKADILVSDGDQLDLGGVGMKFILTPGHTPGGICILVDEKYLITGDTLFIDDCGRCDLPGGSLKDMFDSLGRIRKMDPSLIVYPGHDYGPRKHDTLGNQIRSNKTLRVSDPEEFSKL